MDSIKELFRSKKIIDRRNEAITKLGPYRFEILEMCEDSEILGCFCCCKKSFDNYGCRRKKTSCIKNLLTGLINIYFFVELVLLSANGKIHPLYKKNANTMFSIQYIISKIKRDYNIEI